MPDLYRYQRLVIAPAQFHQDQIALTPAQRHYLMTVLRLNIEDRFIAMNGDGQCWSARIVSPELAQLLAPIEMQTELSVPITLCIAPAKGNQFDDVVRAATELGAVRIVPVISQRTLLKPSSHKVERWQRIATEAAEQSYRLVKPDILEPLSLVDTLQWITAHNQGHTGRYLCVTDATAPPLLRCLPQIAPEIVFLSGPEGGWTEAETALAIANDFQAISLGHRILRAVTAPIAALAIAAAYLDATVQKGEP